MTARHQTFWIGAFVVGTGAAAWPAFVCIDALRTLGRLGEVGSHPAWLGSMFHLAAAALAAAAAVVAFTATVGAAMLGRWCFLRLRR